MQVDPCKVCGNTEVNLVDGYYYCVECGTQDVNARQTIVEHTALADGTFGLTSSKKFSVAIRKDGIQMSGEWYKWHAYNFILAGLSDELIALGAKPSFKSKLFWVWTRYIKKYQKKNEMANSSKLVAPRDNSKLAQFEAEINSDSNNESEIEEQEEEEEVLTETLKQRDIKQMTKGILLALLYVALNLDGSDIQILHLLRFMKEGRLSIHTCTKYVPQEINVKCIPYWKRFQLTSKKKYNPNTIGIYAMQFFRILDLGKPVVPDLKKIVDNFVKELCVPNDFKEFVFSLMQYAPYDFSKITRSHGVDHLLFPNYDGIVMSYILVALKICFGLDDDYEIRLSDAVDKINNQNDYPRSHKFGSVSEPTDRLFSFRKWCNYLQFRKKIVCKYNLTLAEINNLDVDDYVFMEHSDERPSVYVKRNLVDDIAMDMLKKIPHNIEKGIIKKNEFLPTLTPFSTYTELILQYTQDPDLRILLSEDFSQYSLKYACKDLNLQVDSINLVTGIDNSNKIIVNGNVGSDLAGKNFDMSLVYVKNCPNKNWLKTKPPTEHHIIKKHEKNSDEGNDHGYNSKRDDTAESNSADQDDDEEEEDKKKVETIDEEQEGVNIFDDAFEDVDEKEDKMFSDECNNIEADNDFEQIEDKYDTKQHEDILQDFNISQQNEHNSIDKTEDNFDPNLFDRDNAIKSLILDACEKYKIPIPNEYSQKRPLKRKPNLANSETGETNTKRRKTPSEEKKKVDKLLSAYYNNLEQEVLGKLAEEMKLVFKNLISQPDGEPDKTLADSSSVLNESNQFCDQSGINKNSLSHDQVNQMANYDTILNQENRSVEQESNSSVIVNNIENEEKGTEGSICKEDPKFDEKTYDIRQLYLKLQDEINVEEIIDIENTEVDRILDTQFKKFCAKRVAADSESTSSDPDENTPLSVLQRRKMRAKRERKSKPILHKLEPLIKGTYNAPTFNYWIRQYYHRTYKKDDVHRRYELELKRNCPKSFTFVMHECASIIGCSSYTLLKRMQNLERSIFYRLGCMDSMVKYLKF